jgi:cholesterol transport system auxiliary component
MKRWSVLLPLILLSCATPRSPEVRSYDFGMFDARPTSATQLNAPLVILPVSAPSWMRGSAILYRLRYTDPPYSETYRLSRWVATPAELLTMRLLESTAAVNTGFTLASADGNSTGYVIEVAMEEFIHEFESPTLSRGVVQVRVSLVDRSTGEVIAQQTLHAEELAASADAPGGVRALIGAMNAVTAQLMTWIGLTLGTLPSTSSGHRPLANEEQRVR